MNSNINNRKQEERRGVKGSAPYFPGSEYLKAEKIDHHTGIQALSLRK